MEYLQSAYCKLHGFLQTLLHTAIEIIKGAFHYTARVIVEIRRPKDTRILETG